MKKSGQRKLPLSLKTASGKQQKISNFFMTSNAVNEKNNGSKVQRNKDATKDQHTEIETHARLPGENLCTKCLKKSPSINSDVCNQCNKLENVPQSKENVVFSLASNPPLIESPEKKFDSNSKGSNFSSPDIIFATPPVKIRQKNNVKHAKRKCSFESVNNLKKKRSPSKFERNADFLFDKISTEAIKSSKENILSSEPKSNTFGKNSHARNPFCKPPIVEAAVQAHCKRVDNEDIENYEDAAKSLEVLETSSRTVPNLCNFRTLDHNFLDKPNSRPKIVQNYSKDSKNLGNITKIINEFGDIPDVKPDDGFNNGDISCSVHSNENKDIISANSDTNLEDAIEHIFDDLSFLEDVHFKEPLRLDNITRCKVLSVEHLKACGEVVLALTSCDTQVADTVTCVLRGSWVSSSVSEGDIVSVMAKPVAGQEGCWVVDNESGLFVTHPDTLISGTTVVGSLFCMRRSVLSDMYRGIDSDSSIMVIGSFLHQLLQEVLKRKASTLEGIKKILDEFTKSRYFIFNVYSSNMSLDKTMETLKEFIPKIHGFVQKYLSSKSLGSGTKMWDEGNSWNGTITDVADIEENIWSPSLGLKGKIDVTVKTASRNHKEKVMPLELKTGRASFSAEHRGQVILYTMMMSELGKTVDSGLLLYLREGVMKEVPVGAVERRDLMMLRNELVAQLKASQRVVVTSGSEIAAPALPPPIHHHSACSKCPYLTLCSAALRVEGCSEVSAGNPLRELSGSSTGHLEMRHITYVFHWTGLLRLEHTEALLGSPALHHIWTLPPADRAKRGTCVPVVRLVERVVEVVAGSYQHVFQCDSGGAGSLAEGNYVIVSSATRPAVAAGPLTHVSQSHLTLMLERDLSVHQAAENVWFLDKYESQSGLVFNMTNLGCLLDDTEQAERLRRAVIDVELPDFSPKLSSRVLKASVDLLSGLNDQQRKAVFRALAAKHYILIKGMPGTGKTATIVALVQLAVRLGLSVLLTSHTHSAVDNMLLRLRGKVDFLRLGSSHKLHSDLVQYGESGKDFASPDDLHTFYSSKQVVGVTCLGSSHALLSRRKFDLCIVDEATQVLQPTVLRPLFSAHKFILIGDPNQLPPLVRSSKAKELGLGQSLFARLDRPAVTTELSLQYRMNQTITDLANQLTYGGKLECGTAEVANATIKLPESALEGEPDWVCAALNHSLSEAVVALDTGSVGETKACVNTREGDIVLRILATLAKGLTDEKVGVVAPYRAQVEYLRQRAKSVSSLIEVNTVDQYQGRDKDVIIYSCTRSAKPTESDILGDKNRLTVAITRARHKLIIVGNVTLLRDYTVFDELFNSLPLSCIVPVN